MLLLNMRGFSREQFVGPASRNISRQDGWLGFQLRINRQSVSHLRVSKQNFGKSFSFWVDAVSIKLKHNLIEGKTTTVSVQLGLPTCL